MSSYYSSNMIGFLISRPGKGAHGWETWDAELPLDTEHREAIRLGLIKSAGRVINKRNGGAHRPFRLTEEGLSFRDEAIEAKRKDGETGPTLADPRPEPEEETNRDGIIAIVVFGCLATVTWLLVTWMRS